MHAMKKYVSDSECLKNIIFYMSGKQIYCGMMNEVDHDNWRKRLK